MNLMLNGPDRRELRLILADAFDRESLTRALAEAANCREYEDLVTPGKFPDEIVELIAESLRTGWLDELITLTAEATEREDLQERLAKLRERAARLAKEYGTTMTSRPLELEEESEDGDAVVRLCDRQPQEQAMFSRFMTPLEGPMVYLLPGGLEGAHSSFTDRFRYYTLPLLLGESQESFRDVTEPITSPWTAANGNGNDLRYLTAQLARRLDPKVAPAAMAFRSLPRFRNKIVLIQHLVYESKWSPHMLQLIRDYIDFWQPMADASGDRPWFVIFLQVVFDQTEDGAEIMAELQQLVTPEDRRTRYVTLLPPLGLVEPADVHEWIEEHWRKYRTEAQEMLQRLFPRADSRLPMARVEKELAEFMERH